MLHILDAGTYIGFNVILQLIIHTKEKNAIMFTHPPAVSFTWLFWLRFSLDVLWRQSVWRFTVSVCVPLCIEGLFKFPGVGPANVLWSFTCVCTVSCGLKDMHLIHFSQFLFYAILNSFLHYIKFINSSGGPVKTLNSRAPRLNKRDCTMYVY